MLTRILAVLCGVGVLFVAMAMSPSPAPSQAPATADGFEVDQHYSSMLYRIRHMGAAWYWGRVNQPTGSFVLDKDNPEASHVNITIELKNMDTGNRNRNRFVLGPDFFDVRNHPTAEFASTTVTSNDDGTFTVAGDLTMRGVTKPITVTINDYTERQTRKLGYRAGFECVFTVSRREFGMTKFFDDEALGDEVRIIAAIQGVRK